MPVTDTPPSGAPAPVSDSGHPDRAVVRRLLQALLPTDAELNAFCIDYFTQVAERFAGGMDRLDKVNLLLRLAEPSEILARLREQFRTDSSAQGVIDQLLSAPRGELERKSRELWNKLEALYLEREQRLQAGKSSQELDREIVRLKREQRQGSQLAEGEILSDRYRLIEVIGSGGFAKVWKAFDRLHNRSVAVKVLHGEQSSEPGRIERFERGAREMLLLDHPHIVRVLDGPSEHKGHHFFVMELLAGGDLFRAVVKGRVERPVALRAILQVGEALSYAHARGLIHRDIKPQNILLDAVGTARLTDFDLVWAADTTGGTRTGAMGTFLFSAPEEMADASRIDQRADVYALGMTTIFVLLGKSLSRDVLDRRLLVIDRLDCPEPLRVLLRQTTAPDPEDRPPTVAAFCARLSATMSPARSDYTPVPTLPSVKPVSPNAIALRVWMPILFAGTLLASLGLGVYIWRKHAPTLSEAGTQQTRPSPPSPSAHAEFAEMDHEMARRHFAVVIQIADRIILNPSIDGIQKDDAKHRKALAAREVQNQLSYERFAASAVSGEYEQAIAAYGEIDSKSAFLTEARDTYNHVFAVYADNHLKKAATLLQQGLCEEFKRELQAVLVIEPTHARSQALQEQPCPDKAAPETAPKGPRPPSKRPAVELRQTEAALDTAEAETLAGNYQKAKALAQTALTASPERAWRLLGTVACMMRDVHGVIRAYSQLSSNGREYVRGVCARNGLPKLADELNNEDSMLKIAQTEYVDGNYDKAIAAARLVAKSSPIRAHRIIGSSGCYTKDLRLVADAFTRVDTSGRQYIAYVCQRNGIQNVNGTFRLVEPPKRDE